MSLVAFLNTRFGVTTALMIAQGTPPRVGYRITDWAASFFARRRRTDLVKAVYLNQWVISGKQKNAVELHRATVSVFRSTGRNYYDFYHNLDRPEVVKNLVRLDDSFYQHVAPRTLSGGEGTMLAIPHVSAFDLAGRALALSGYELQILSYPVTPGGYKLQNRMRNEAGLEVTPMNFDAMRKAKQRLKNGGLVLTGLDRPMESSNYPVRFFGYPTTLPVAYIRLAMQVDVPVAVCAVHHEKDGYYYLKASPPMRMKTDGDEIELLIHNAERVLSVAEEFIRQKSNQWAMFYPIWPQFLQQVPRWSDHASASAVAEKA